MWKVGVASATALFVSLSTLAHAQAPQSGTRWQLSPADWGALTDARIAITKAALQLTPEQQKHWPAVADALRASAEHRQARIASRLTRIGELRNGGLEAVRDRNPVDLMNRRADALAQRAADLKRLAEAWQPLYQSLTPEQRQRMGFATIIVLRRMDNAAQSGADTEATGATEALDESDE
jgi:Spy/CpxP family protein refolding chaperone